MKKQLAILALSTLTACGSLANDSGLSRTISVLRSGRQAAPAVDVEAWVGGAATILMALPATGWGGLLRQMGENGNRITWTGITGKTVTTQDGVLVATRGFGSDLYASDVDGVYPALLAGGGTFSRSMEFLNGNDRIARVDLHCSIERKNADTVSIQENSFATTRFEETCTSDQIAFVNVYWLGNEGKIRQSQQWMSPSVTHLLIQNP